MIDIYTIGHSTWSWPDFVSLLKENSIQLLVDVRRYPHSKRFPHFNRVVIEINLASEGIDYLWKESLGGWRRSGLGVNSPNFGLRSPGLRNYADHMLTGEFQGAVQQIIALAPHKKIALLCDFTGNAIAVFCAITW